MLVDNIEALAMVNLYCNIEALVVGNVYCNIEDIEALDIRKFYYKMEEFEEG